MGHRLYLFVSYRIRRLHVDSGAAATKYSLQLAIITVVVSPHNTWYYIRSAVEMRSDHFREDTTYCAVAYRTRKENTARVKNTSSIIIRQLAVCRLIKKLHNAVECPSGKGNINKKTLFLFYFSKKLCFSHYFEVYQQ